MLANGQIVEIRMRFEEMAQAVGHKPLTPAEYEQSRKQLANASPAAKLRERSTDASGLREFRTLPS
jgi:hypothetical protein